MKKIYALILLICFIILAFGCTDGGEESDISTDGFDPEAEGIYSEKEINNKILGGYIGQMAGVVYGANSEFHYRGEIMPEEDVVDFLNLDINNAFWQDDLYVEMTFLKVMEENGFDCGIELFGEAFANSQYPLDHANNQARENLKNGIHPTLSGHYDYNLHCDDIDWQIESDFIGLICAGDPLAAAKRAFELGHMICYGDGVYGGVFVASATAAAFTAESVDEIVDAAMNSVPNNSEFKTVLKQVVSRYEGGKSWEECWAYIQEKWGNDDRCVSYSAYDSNIDAKLNAAYVLIGLLYGEGNFENSLTIALRCGQDNDCNASTVGGILGTMLGYDAIPEKFKTGLDKNGETFSFTAYTLNGAVEAVAKLLKERTTSPAAGYWEIHPVQAVSVELEQWPEAPTVFFEINVDKNIARISTTAYSVPGISKTEIDFGDGFVTDQNVAGYSYSEEGEYTVKYTVTDIHGNSTVVTKDITVSFTREDEDTELEEYRNLAPEMVPICSVTAPLGTGNTDIFIMNDGAVGVSLKTQYDTYQGYLNSHKDYIGYIFKNKCSVDKLIFTEGMNFDNGGWFADGTVTVQVLVNDTWTNINAKISPSYPNSNEKDGFGEDFEEYTFTFNAVECDGIRIIGTAGGEAGFISVSELAVMGEIVMPEVPEVSE